MSGSAQKPPDDRARSAEIDDTGVAFAKDRHYVANVSYACRPRLCNGRPSRYLDLAFVQLPG